MILNPTDPDPPFTQPVAGPPAVAGSNTLPGMPLSFQSFDQRPAIGCCKLERWNKRSYMRKAEKVRTTYERLCSANNSESFAGTAVRGLNNYLYTCMP